MKKKVGKLVIFACCIAFLLFNFTSGETVYATGGDTQVDCYSAWETGGTWTIYKCGDCKEKKNVKAVANPGKCRTPPSS
jgi:hypothetical protein